MTVRSRTALVAVAVALVAAACVGQRFGRSAATRGTYLALGDSLAFGYEPAGMRPAPDYHDASTFVGYPEDVGRSEALEVVNASCPGETVASLISTTALNNDCSNTDGKSGGYRTAFPLHVDYATSQLDFAIKYLKSHHRVRLVTIDIGLNDVAVCEQITADHCAAPGEQASLLAEVRNGLNTIYGQIRKEAGYSGPMVALSYYATEELKAPVVTALNAAISSVIAPYGGTVADGYGAFRRAGAPSGGDPCRAGLVIRLPSGDCDEHPTARGQSLLAAAIVQAMAR